jgi:type I restriction enzyme S subunit
LLKQESIGYPPLSEQERIVSLLDAQFAKIDAIKANAEKQLHEARNLLNKTISEYTSYRIGWNKSKLKDVCSIIGEYGLNESATTFNGVRYLRITDITADGELNDEKVSCENSQGKSQKKLEEGDILFARTGATVGKTLVYKNDFGDCNFAGYLIRYRTNPNEILPKYLFYYTHSSRYYEWVDKNQAAAAQPNISAQKYNNFVIEYPSTIEEQINIVTSLDNIFDKVKFLEYNCQQTVTLCNDLKQSILKDIFG